MGVRVILSVRVVATVHVILCNSISMSAVQVHVIWIYDEYEYRTGTVHLIGKIRNVPVQINKHS